MRKANLDDESVRKAVGHGVAQLVMPVGGTFEPKETNAFHGPRIGAPLISGRGACSAQEVERGDDVESRGAQAAQAPLKANAGVAPAINPVAVAIGLPEA